MSDVPEGYFLGPRGEILLDYRRDVRLLPHPGKRRAKLNNNRKGRLAYRILLRDGDRCHYCNCEIFPVRNDQKKPNSMTLEHVVPKCVGGSNRLDNLVLACDACNNFRGDLPAVCVCDFCISAYETFEAEVLTLEPALC